MDVGDQHAALLLATAAVPAAALLFLRRCRPSPVRALLAVVVLGATPTRIYHLCGAGTASTQVLVPMVAGLLVVLFLAPRIMAAVLTLAIVASAYHLTNEYTDLVHTRGWTGNPAWVLRLEEVSERGWREHAVERVASAPGRYLSRPAGWLDETKLLQYCPVSTRTSVHSAWHTWFTRLWRTTSRARRLWYPGGPPPTAAAHLEWRDD